MQLSPRAFSPPSRSAQPRTSHPAQRSSAPVIANFDSAHLTISCGVAIFHLASERVVLCYHTRDKYWFLPKGRKDAGESFEQAACREGFEESGFRNRLLPLPMRHRQPIPHGPERERGELDRWRYITEPHWCQLVPHSASSQYMLFWYVAETLPPDVETEVNAKTAEATATAGASAEGHAEYVHPPPFPHDLKLKERVAMEPEGYFPPRHPNTGVDEEEALYDSQLVTIDEALERLRGSTMADVVRRGWEGIKYRVEDEGFDS